MDETDYNYIWTKWVKAYESGNFFEMDKENIETLFKARGFLRCNSVHTDAWQEFKKYIDRRQESERNRLSAREANKDNLTNDKARPKNTLSFLTKGAIGAIIIFAILVVRFMDIGANLTQILDFFGMKPENRANSYNSPVISDIRGEEELANHLKKEIVTVASDENFSPITLEQYLKGYKNDSLTNLQHETFIDTHIKKKVIWEGRIESVRHGSFGDYEVEFESENYPYYSVICKFNKEDKEDLLKLKSGQHIQVTGIFTDHSYNKLVLEDCRILRIE